jgi:hypothetical protein
MLFVLGGIFQYWFSLLGMKKLNKKIVGNENEEDFWSDTVDVAYCRHDGWLQ